MLPVGRDTNDRPPGWPRPHKTRIMRKSRGATSRLFSWMRAAATFG